MTRRTASGVLPAAESEMIVTGLFGYCCACAAIEIASSQTHAIVRKREPGLMFISPSSDQSMRPGESALTNDVASTAGPTALVMARVAAGRRQMIQ